MISVIDKQKAHIKRQYQYLILSANIVVSKFYDIMDMVFVWMSKKGLGAFAVASCRLGFD